MLQALSGFAQAYSYPYTFNSPTPTTSTLGTGFVVELIIILLIFLLIVIGVWKVFRKAGKHGWAAIIPVYNGWVMSEVAGKPGWWTFLLLIPFVNIIISAILAVNIAKNFGKSGAFGLLGLWLFSFIGYPILGFGKATYRPGGGQSAGPGASAPAPQSPANPAPPTGTQPPASVPPSPPAGPIVG